MLSVPAFGAAARLHRWWKPKAAPLLGVLYAVALATSLPFATTLALLPPALLAIAGIGSFGHLVNDWFDVDADRHAGKPNALAALTRAPRLALLGVAVAAAALPWMVLPFDAVSGILLSVEVALLLAYAVPPIRLKERNVWPVLADGAYAYAVPAILAAHTFFLASGQPSDRRWLATLCVWELALGVRHYLNHVALDRLNDLASGTATVATRRGSAFVHTLIRQYVLPIELLALLLYLLIVSQGRPALFGVITVVLFASTALHAVLTIGRGYPLLPYRFSHSHVDRLHQDVVPLCLLAWLAAADWRFLLLFAGHALLFASFGGLPMRRWRQRRGHDPAPSPATPLVVTAPAPAAEWPLPPPAPVVRQRPLTIAVANVNKGKYTETFVDGLNPLLPYRVLHLHGGELPRYDADDRHFLSNWPSLQAMARTAEVVLRLNEGHFLRNSIAGYLQAQDVRLVLAHFGPVGVEMLPIARDLGLPLVVWFHGYDVFHDQTRRRWAASYPALFREAAAILGVSARMLTTLEAMGAPRNKLVHLPAFVNLRLFPGTDRRSRPPHFLAVGRMTEAKSPHLTILAFQRVAQAVPGATLTLVGKGGGGELFEACLILVRALGLEDRVTLAGVLSHEEVAREMRRARVFVQHSVTTPEHGDREGKPVAVMEAMASGLPVVATRHSGIVELIDDGVTGLLVEEFDVSGMADAMIRLAQDDELVARLGRAASDAMHQHPLVAGHVEVLATVIDRAIAGR